MSHAEKCPVCENQQPHQVQSEFGSVTCRGCGGKGWVEVSDTVVQTDILGKAHIVNQDYPPFKAGGTAIGGIVK